MRTQSCKARLPIFPGSGVRWDAVAIRRQRDPYDTDGVVGSWRLERLVGVYAIEVEGGIVVVG